jgi:hypothetical protein
MATAEIKTKATLDGKGFQAGIAKMQQSVSSWKNGQLKSMAGAIGGAFAVSAVAGFAKGALDAADALSDTAAATGLNTTQIQALTAAGNDWGASQEDVIAGLVKLETLQQEVAKGGGESLKQTFDALGISADEFATISTDGLIDIIAKAKPTADVLKDLFGKSGPLKFKGIFGDLGAAGGLEGLAKEKADQIMTPEAIARAGAVADKAGQLEKKLKAGAINIASKAVELTQAETEATLKKLEAQKKITEEIKAQEIANKIKSRAEFKAKIESEAMAKAEEKRGKISVGAAQAADQFARIGAFSGGQMDTANKALALGERQLAEAEIMAEYLAEIKKNTGE